MHVIQLSTKAQRRPCNFYNAYRNGHSVETLQTTKLNDLDLASECCITAVHSLLAHNISESQTGTGR